MKETKRCSKCGIEKLRNEFPKNSSRIDGLHNYCLACHSESNIKSYRKANPIKEKEILPPNKKRCSKCGEVKAKAEFHKDKYKDDGLTSNCKLCRGVKVRKDTPDGKLICSSCGEIKNIDNFNVRKDVKQIRQGVCKDCIKQRSQAYYKKNRFRILKNKKEYYRENIEKIRKYRQIHIDRIKKYYEINQERHAKSMRRHYEKNKAKINKLSKKRYHSLTPYDVYSYQLSIDEEPICDDEGYLLVKCTYCGRYFYPKLGEVKMRARSLIGTNLGEARLYCSDSCKKACPVYYMKKWPKDHKPATSREVQPELRQMRLEIDDYTCQNEDCQRTIDEAELHCHHNTSVRMNPIESADLDNCITLCKKCHKMVHKECDGYFKCD